MRDQFRESRHHYQYIDFRKTSKFRPMKNEQRQKIYKLCERIITPKSLHLPYLYTEQNDTKHLRLNTTPPKSSSKTHSNSNKHKQLRNKESSTQTPRKHLKEEIKSQYQYTFISKEYYSLPALQTNLSNILQPQYQIVDVLSDVVDKVSDNCSNAPRINIMRSEYLINKINKENRILEKKLIKSRKEIKSKEEEEEQYDTVVYEDYYQVRLKNILRNYLRSKDNKLNQRAKANATDKFFALFENQINYNFDVYAVPYFMNKFIRFNIDNIDQMRQFNSHNYIDPGILRYLYKLRITIQREKEETEKIKKKREGVVEDNEGLQHHQGQTGKAISDIVNKTRNDSLLASDSNNATAAATNKSQLLKKSATINPNVYQVAKKTQDNQEAKPPEEESSVYSLKVYEMEDFFIHKYIRYEGIGFANEKEKDFIYNKFHDLSFKEYYSVHIPQVMSKL